MKKTRMLSTMAAAIVVVGFVPPTSRNLATHLAMFDDPNGPPITVSDGSIHADTHRLFHFFSEKTPFEVYTANAYDRDYIRFDGFTDDSGNGPPSPLQNTGGWLIRISNGNPGNETNQDSISVCSTASDAKKPTPDLPNTTCLLGPPDPNEEDKWVYLETHPNPRPKPPTLPTLSAQNGQNGRWDRDFLRKRLNFHDTRGGCENGVCDHIAYIIIKTMNQNSPPRQDGSTTPLPGPDGHKYTCNVVDQCTISIGRYP